MSDWTANHKLFYCHTSYELRTDRQFSVIVVEQKRSDGVHAEADLVAVESSS